MKGLYLGSIQGKTKMNPFLGSTKDKDKDKDNFICPKREITVCCIILDKMLIHTSKSTSKSRKKLVGL